MSEKEVAVQENISLPEDVRTWQQQLIRRILRAMVVIGPLALVGGAYSAYTAGKPWQIPFYLAAYAVLLLITFWSRVPYELQVGAFVSLLYGLSVFELLEDGLSGSGRVFLLTFALIVVLFFGRRSTIFALGFSVLTLATFGWAFSTNRIVVPLEALATSLNPITWVSSTIVFFMIAGLMTFSQSYLVPTLINALAQSRRLAQELEMHRASLEERVADRTRDLERRTHYLEATAKVARDASSVLDPQELLSRAVALISERFGFYHTGIFLLDPGGEWAILQAASSQGGRRMLARGHRLRVGQEGIVGYVTGWGEPRIALDVGADAVFFNNPDLPDTRSEMALPLQARGEIIGALDVQSTEPEAFSDEDVAVLQTLADQVAVAISNARLLQQVQQSLEAERLAHGELSRQAWRELIRAQPELGFLSNKQGVYPVGDLSRPEMEVALRTGQTAPGENSATSLSMPVKVRGHVIGVVSGRKPQDAGEWTAEEMALMETLTEQLSVALESARLYQDTQRRAARERLTHEVTARMRETLDLETVLKTAAQQVRQTLKLPEVVIRLRGPAAGEAGDGVE